MSDEKTCTKCGERKSITEFWRNARTRDGLQHACKLCSTALMRESRARKTMSLGRRPRGASDESTALLFCMQTLDGLTDDQRRRVLSMLNAREGTR